MPNIKEEYEAGLAEMDAELASLPGVSLEDVFKLGQDNPGKPLMELAFKPLPHGAGYIPVRDHLVQESTPEELAALRAEQDPQVVGKVSERGLAPKVQTYAGDIKCLQGISWLDLSQLETKTKLRDQLRNRAGRREQAIVREAPTMAFISLMIRAATELPEWVYMVVFVSEPHEDRVRFVLGYTRTEPEPTEIPAWVKAIPERSCSKSSLQKP
jgi:hypothetical protein